MKLKQFSLNEKTQRRVYGKLVDILDLDYTQDLDTLRHDIEEALFFLPTLNGLGKKFRKVIENKDVRVYRGGHHLDVVINGAGGLGWLTVADSPLCRQELSPLKPLTVSLNDIV